MKLLSMGIVGVKSTAGREVKFFDPSKTTRSESAWLGYSLCDCFYIYIYIYIYIYNAFYFFPNFFYTYCFEKEKEKSYHILFILHIYMYKSHYTMKNEGWGFKEDQIPSSSHCLHQTMGSQLHINRCSRPTKIYILLFDNIQSIYFYA